MEAMKVKANYNSKHIKKKINYLANNKRVKTVKIFK